MKLEFTSDRSKIRLFRRREKLSAGLEQGQDHQFTIAVWNAGDCRVVPRYSGLVNSAWGMVMPRPSRIAHWAGKIL